MGDFWRIWKCSRDVCPARQVSVLKRQRSGLNQLIKMLQFPFPPFARAFIRHFQTEPEFKLLFFLKKKRRCLPLAAARSVASPEMAPRSMLSVIKAPKSAAGWWSQISSALRGPGGAFCDGASRFRLAAIAPGRRVPGRRRAFFTPGPFP